MQYPLFNSGVKTGTISGTFLAMWLNIHPEEWLKTAATAAIGATISFCVSLGLNWLAKRFRR